MFVLVEKRQYPLGEISRLLNNSSARLVKTDGILERRWKLLYTLVVQYFSRVVAFDYRALLISTLVLPQYFFFSRCSIIHSLLIRVESRIDAPELRNCQYVVCHRV